jgi:hypothetical protein
MTTLGTFGNRKATNTLKEDQGVSIAMISLLLREMDHFFYVDWQAQFAPCHGGAFSLIHAGLKQVASSTKREPKFTSPFSRGHACTEKTMPGRWLSANS